MGKGKQEVIKSSAAIHTQNNTTLLQRRAWNVLLANAYDELPEQEVHYIPIADIENKLQIGANNEEYLKESLLALMTCVVEWNLLDKETETWKASTLLAEVGFTKDKKSKTHICEYAYGPELRRRLYNPAMYARIHLGIQNKFTSKHSQALWELCVDYLDESRNCGETPYIELWRLKKILGIPDGGYSGQFKILNRDVIKPAIDEINKKTDFHVDSDPRREGRSVAKIKFLVRRTLALPGRNAGQMPMFPQDDDMPDVVRELKSSGLSADDAWPIWQKGFEGVNAQNRPSGIDFETYVREKIDLLKRNQENGKIKSSATGFLLKALSENYANPEFALANKEQAKKQRTKKRQAAGRRKQRVTGEKTKLEKERRAAVHEICKGLIDKQPELLDVAVEALVSTDEQFSKLYKPGDSALKNYRSGAFLRTYFERFIEEQYPDHFKEIRNTYDERLASLTNDISDLEKAAA